MISTTATVVNTTTRRTDTLMDTGITRSRVVGGATGQPTGSKESSTTGHVVSTCSSVEATVIRGVDMTQEVRREDRSTVPGSAVYENFARKTTF